PPGWLSARGATACWPPRSPARWSPRAPVPPTGGPRSARSAPTCSTTPATRQPRRRCSGRCGRRVSSAVVISWPGRCCSPQRRPPPVTPPPAHELAPPLVPLMALEGPRGEQRHPDRDHQADRPLAAEGGLAVLALTHVDRHLDEAQLGVGDPHQRFDLGRFAQVIVGQELERGAVDRIPAPRVVGSRS